MISTFNNGLSPFFKEAALALCLALSTGGFSSEASGFDRSENPSRGAESSSASNSSVSDNPVSNSSIRETDGNSNNPVDGSAYGGIPGVGGTSEVTSYILPNGEEVKVEYMTVNNPKDIDVDPNTVCFVPTVTKTGKHAYEVRPYPCPKR